MEPAKGYGFVKTKEDINLNLYDKPSQEGEILKSIPNGSFVHLLGYTNGLDQMNGESGRWCKISYVGTEGWVWEKFISRK